MRKTPVAKKTAEQPAPAPALTLDKLFPVQWYNLTDLKGHPDNPRQHSDENVAELQASLDEDDWLQNVVVSSDGFLLGGHGICMAATKLGMTRVPGRAYPLPHDHPKSLKVMVKLNTLGMPRKDDPTTPQDDQDILTGLLRSIAAESERGLQGTGITEAALEDMLAELAAQHPPTGFVPPEFREYDENIDLSNVKRATCPECGHEFPV